MKHQIIGLMFFILPQCAFASALYQYPGSIPELYDREVPFVQVDSNNLFLVERNSLPEMTGPQQCPAGEYDCLGDCRPNGVACSHHR